ncbi:hypothetical protein G5I_09434 [Acromyrmex echinatior]|uniref:Uncharacterized protein n=1 Tax=Acromyrmex echinatior TaxID=103372 RepID=F4WU77_ACREC|nr:hypothetical protein G5I_09434 [Acromyrmex echinatior]
MWILAKYCHATAPIDQQPLHAFLANNPRGYSHSYQSHSGIYMRDMQRTTAGISVDGMRGAANGSPRVRYQTVCGSRRCISATYAAFHNPAPAAKKRTLISIEMANDNFSVSSHLIYDVPADLATRSKNVAADPLSDRFYSSLLAPSWPISRTWTTLVRSLSASRLALASQQQQQPAAQALVISDATSYFTRASPRSTFLCGSYDVGSAEENEGHPVTVARRKLTAAAVISYGCRAVDAYRRPWGALCRLWESRRRELLTIDRRKGSAASRVSDALRTYIAYENPCAK